MHNMNVTTTRSGFPDCLLTAQVLIVTISGPIKQLTLKGLRALNKPFVIWLICQITVIHFIKLVASGNFKVYSKINKFFSRHYQSQNFTVYYRETHENTHWCKTMENCIGGTLGVISRHISSTPSVSRSFFCLFIKKGVIFMF